jgi:hypothetical protein
MKQLKFYKEVDNSWYIDLPDWEGSKADLLMVSGADTMLDMIAEGDIEVRLSVSETYFKNSDEIIFERMADDIGDGAYYTLKKYRGIEFNHELWLCDVTLSVLGKFPERIFFSKY